MADYVCFWCKRSFQYETFKDHFCFIKEKPDNECSESYLDKIDEELEKLEEAKRNQKFIREDFGEASLNLQCHDAKRNSSLEREMNSSPNISCKGNVVKSTFSKTADVNYMGGPLGNNNEPLVTITDENTVSVDLDTDDLVAGKCKTLASPVAGPSYSSDDVQYKVSNGRNICPEYEKELRYESDFVVHLRSHSGEMPYACNLCDYKCSHKGHMQKHLRTHTGEKPYSCNECDYKCSEKGSLQRHLRIHTGEKPYSCDQCDYKSIHNYNLQRHLRTHKGNQTHICFLCGKVFSNALALSAHCRTAHNKN